MTKTMNPVCGYESREGTCQRPAVCAIRYPQFPGRELYCEAHQPTAVEIQEMDGITIEEIRP